MVPRTEHRARSTEHEHTTVTGRLFLLTVMMGLAAAMPAHTALQPSGLPPRLEHYLANVVRLSAGEHARLLAGEPVTKLLEADASKEVAVFGAVWINARRALYVERQNDIETFERGGGFRITKRISDPPRIEDFAELRIPDEDFADLRTCRVGDCIIKLGEQGIDRLRATVNWTSPTARADADALMRQLALEFVSGYLQGGNDRLAVYRDHSRPRFVADEFRSMIEAMPELATYMPETRRYLLDYPNATLPNATSFLYWQETEFGLRPTVRISHVIIRDTPDDTVVASKMLYASHYFWTGLELRVLLPDQARGPGFWFVTVSCSRSDGLSGFTGLFVRRRARSEVENGTLAGLRMTRQALEASR